MISDEDKSRMLAGLLFVVGSEAIRLGFRELSRWLDQRHTDASRSRPDPDPTKCDIGGFQRTDDPVVVDAPPGSDPRKTGRDNPYGPGRPRRWVKGGTKLPPGTAGEYRIVDKKTGSVEYVGESGDLQRRLNQHTRRTMRPTTTDKSGLYDPERHEIFYQVAKPGTSTERRREHEKRKIAEHEPSWNSDGGGGGRK